MSRVAVVGGGTAGLCAAWELSRAGAEVELFEARAHLGGAVSVLGVGGVRLDGGAEAFATRSTEVADLISDLGLADQIVSPHPAGAWVQLPELAAALPATGVLGIPGDPQADDVVAILGRESADRAAADYEAPMTWPAEHAAAQPSLGEVVRDRMGDAVVDKLVAPITSGVHSSAPDDLAISAAHPRLYATMIEQGSLARAVTALKAAAPAGSAVQSLHGGMHTLITALQRQLQAAGASIRTATEVSDLQQIRADHIVLAADQRQAAALAAPYAPVPPADGGTGSAGVALVTALVHAPGLDSFPRGTGMLVAPTVDHIGAKAMTHISAKWQWVRDQLAEQSGPGHHLLRLSYGRVTDDPAAGALGFGSSDEKLLAAAAADIPALTGVPMDRSQILDAAVVRWQQSLPAASAAQRRAAEQLKSALADSRTQPGPTLWAVGAWASGTGLAQVVPHARRTAGEILAAE